MNVFVLEDSLMETTALQLVINSEIIESGWLDERHPESLSLSPKVNHITTI